MAKHGIRMFGGAKEKLRVRMFGGGKEELEELVMSDTPIVLV
jgi:hypothetical protein